MKKKIAAALAIGVMLTLNGPGAQAMTVYDPTVHAQLKQNYIDQIKNTVQTYQQLQNQLTQLQNEAKNLEKLDPDALTQLNGQIGQTFQQMQQLSGTIQTIGSDYTKLQQEWDETYKNFGDFNGMKGADYASYMQKLLNGTDDKIKKAMASQGLLNDATLQNEQTQLQNMLQNSQNAQGSLSAIQAGNQIAAMQINELLRMQKIMSDSFGAQAVFLKKQQEQEKAAKARTEAFLQMEKSDTTVDSGRRVGQYNQ